MKWNKRTVSVEEFHEVVVRPAGEFLSPECFADDPVVAENDDELGSEPEAENAAVFLGKVRQFLVELPPDVRQVADEREAVGSGREAPAGPPPSPGADASVQERRHGQRVPKRLAARSVHHQMKQPSGQTSKTPHDHFSVVFFPFPFFFFCARATIDCWAL